MIRPRLRFSFALLVVLLLALVSLLGCGKSSAPRHGPGASSGPTPTDAPAARRAMLEIRAELEVEVSGPRDAEALARPLIELANRVGGHVELFSLGEESGASQLVLRVPPTEIDAVRGVLSRGGPIVREQQTAKDVTDAIVDLDARASAAKQEEARILKLLEERTGTLADVLATEKALGEVRERIERMAGEQRAAHGRVELATVQVSIRHHAEDLPLGRRLVVAARDGFSTAKDAAIGTLVVALRILPTALVFAPLAWLVILLLRRARKVTPAV